MNRRDLTKDDVRISALLGCGTYIVKDRNGIQVFLTDPNEPWRPERSTPSGNNNPSRALWRCSRHKQKISDDFTGRLMSSLLNPDPLIPFSGDELTACTITIKQPKRIILCGEKVQISGTKDGVAKLSQGIGFLVATLTQLLKGEKVSSSNYLCYSWKGIHTCMDLLVFQITLKIDTINLSIFCSILSLSHIQLCFPIQLLKQ